jgi:alpha-mannosidase
MNCLARFAMWSAAVVLGSPMPCPAQLQELWSIGIRDDNTAEFANAPGDYRGYRGPACFVVGSSEPGRDWPYVQPGTNDGSWAPGTPQTFEAWFGLADVPKAPCRLVLDFVDTHSVHPPLLRVHVNGASWELATPRGAGDASVYGDPSLGREHAVSIEVPASALIAGDNVVSITPVRGSWVLWDAVRFDAPAGTRVIPVVPRTEFLPAAADPSPAILRQDGNPAQPVTLSVRHIGSPTEASLHIGSAEPVRVHLRPGVQQIRALAAPVDEPVTRPAILRVKGVEQASTDIVLKPVPRREIHLIHQTHLDIGYTHHQDEVLAKQVEYLRQAMDYIEQTKDYPEGARFIWHPEGMWAVDEFMRIASDDEQARFIQACRNRQIHLDVLYAQAMTGMYTEEELFELMGAAKRFEAEHGVPIDSAMQSDVPGYTWGLAAALAHHGVKYMSIGPNHFHRMGYTFEWGDKPFWWVDPSGEHRVLFWMCGDGYAYFHSRQLDESSIFSYLEGLARKGYPYEMSIMRYCIGGDNGPPRRELSDFVKSWNEKYVTPRLVIARNSDALEEFAERYGQDLPVIRGDFTPYWEDGSASTALATGINRRACEQIAQVQKLWGMLRPDLDLHRAFDRAWTKMIMYDEHTWGAHNSISQPDSEFAIQQDRYKQQFAHDGASMTQHLLEKVTGADQAGQTATFEVYNTQSWARDGLVVLSAEQSAAGDRVVGADGQVIPSQRLASGGLAFVARGVPPLGAQRYTVLPGQALATGRAHAGAFVIVNGRISLTIDAATGAIASMKFGLIERELVDQSRNAGLNSYLYIIGRDPSENRMSIESGVSVIIEDAGPLVATLRIESPAPGSRSLTRRVRLVDGLDSVFLLNTTDKLRERRPEGLYFSFPFDIPDAVARVDVPWAVVQVEKDQLPGANRNYYCVQRFVDLSNEDFGVTWSPIDAPMVQFDPIKIAAAGDRKTWRTVIDPGSFLHSWTMNNHWETNYKADQEGLISFAYVMQPHAGGYNPVAAQRFGRDACQPLVVAPVTSDSPFSEPPLELVGDDGIVLTSLRPSRDGRAVMARLFNVHNQAQRVSLRWSDEFAQAWISNPMEHRVSAAPETIELAGFAIVTVRIEKPSAPK